MTARPKSALLDGSLRTDPRGTWVLWDRGSSQDVELAQKVDDFESLDYPAGSEAARWLREDALDNDPMTRTRLLVTAERVEGFIATCFGSVELTWSGRRLLPVPRRLQRKQAPAFLVCWVAKHRETDIPGSQLMLTALGLARDAQRNSGLVAFALDPMDDEVAMMWQGEPWRFRRCKERDDGRPTRLYLPI